MDPASIEAAFEAQGLDIVARDGGVVIYRCHCGGIVSLRVAPTTLHKTHSCARCRQARVVKADKILRPSKSQRRTWANKVKARDCYTCKKCKSTVDPEAHHKKPWNSNDASLDLDNGITLCRKCHTKYHEIYGHD